MLNQTIDGLEKRFGKGLIPIVLSLFSLILILTMFTSVRQKNVDLKEGQVATESIRANKTIENSTETDQKRKLAAEAVTPEYIYQPDLATVQHDRIDKLFTLIKKANDGVNKTYQDKISQAKDGEVIPTPTSAERLAALKKMFEEESNQDDVAFYQQIPNAFYEPVMTMTSQEIATVKSESLRLIDEQMAKRVRDENVQSYREEAYAQIEFADLSDDQKQAIHSLIDNGIVVNDVLNEKRTDELRKQARNSVQPVMIYQGEVIVREGSQIDANAINKLQLLGMTKAGSSVFPLIALVLAVLLQIAVLLAYIRQPMPNRRIRFLLFYLATMMISVIIMKFLQVFQGNEASYIALLFPAAFAPMILTSFVNRRAGAIAALFQTIFALFIYYGAIGTNFLTVILMTYLFSGVAATMVKQQRVSDQETHAALWVIIFPVLMNIVLNVYQGMTFGDGKTWMMVLCALAGSILSMLLGMGLYPYIELFVSDNSVIVLNELSNPNHPLLKQLLEEAPGTYHHSMMVANLSANAVAEIGGSSLLTRVACYYHDIGKIKHANFFVENLPPGAENPHNFLLPEDSKQIIFGHVLDGAKILEEHKMPQRVIDICYQHHGTTLMRYFYVKAKERNPDTTEAEFRYPGPKPQSREAGVVSIADSCEAAVRAMDQPSMEKIQEFVHQLIEDRINDGQLDETGLNLQEIRMIEKSLVSGLSSSFHSRIKYPKMKKEAKEMKEEQERRGN